MIRRRINKEQRERAEEHLLDHPQVRLTPQELDNLTRAVGGDIGGFDFEMEEAYYGTPGRITVMGQVIPSGRYYEFDLRIVSAYRVTKDMR